MDEPRKTSPSPEADGASVDHVRSGVNTLGQAAPDRPATKLANAFAVTLVLAAKDGWLLIEGWVDDSFDAVREIRIGGSAEALIEGRRLGRLPRQAGADETPPAGLSGFMGLVKSGGLTPLATGDFTITIILRSGRSGSVITRGLIGPNDLVRNRYLASLPAVGGGQDRILPYLHLEQGAGEALLTLNREIVTAFCRAPYVVRFGDPERNFAASIIVCIYGRAEYLFLQAALFSTKKIREDFEFIYVCNSPDLSDIMQSEARLAAALYDISITLILLPGNAGFGAANNVAAQHARSERLIFINPDVFPKDEDWAERHAAVIEDRPTDETQLFGCALFYEDGSLMHGGMYLAADQGVTFAEGRTLNWSLLRVEHFGKGAPPDTVKYMAPRPVPAVTGAFLSIARSWFNDLGGFDVDYVLGHYEDADLCLRSARAGTRPWIQPLKLWHLEGQGSPSAPEHAGSAVVNRWVFSGRWTSQIDEILTNETSLSPLPAEMHVQ